MTRTVEGDLALVGQRGGTGTAARLQVLVVDDSEVGRRALALTLRAMPAVAEVHSVPDAVSALRLLQQTRVDLMVVHAGLPGLSGFDLGRIVRRFAIPPAVTFIAASITPDQAVEAFEVGATDFVLRTASGDRLAESLRRLPRRHPPTMPSLAGAADGPIAPSVGRPFRPTPPGVVDVVALDLNIPPPAVRWMESNGNYVRVYTSKESWLIRGPLGALVEKWADAGVVRIHKSYAVRVGAVSEIRRFGGGYTVVVSGRELPVARRLARGVRERLLGKAARQSAAA